MPPDRKAEQPERAEYPDERVLFDELATSDELDDRQQEDRADDDGDDLNAFNHDGKSPRRSGRAR